MFGLNVISTKVHGVLDYSTAGLLLSLSEVMDMGDGARRMMQGAAAAHAGYSLFTDYELGVSRQLPMQAHLAMDAVGALAFIAAGALMRDEDAKTRALLAGIGVYELAATLMTEPRPRPSLEQERRLVSETIAPVARQRPLVTERVDLDEVKLGDQI